MSTPTIIDYLNEDPPVRGQRYALISIIGPHITPKSDTWGIKVKCTTNTIEEAQDQAKKMSALDSYHNIFILEVGKFAPLDVSPEQIKDNEYSDKQLNELMKKYKESRDLANTQWEDQKNRQIKAAEEDAKEETPTIVLQRILDMKEKHEATVASLKLEESKFESFTPEQIAEAKENISKLEAERELIKSKSNEPKVV